MSEKKELNELQKWIISLWSALLFLFVASPLMFKITGSLFSKLGIKIQQNGCPNITGLIIHSIIFAVIIRLMMAIPLR